MPPGRPVQRATLLSALFLCCLAHRAVGQASGTVPSTLRVIPSSPADGARPVAATHRGGGQQDGASGCPLPALYVVFSLPNICSDGAFIKARANFVAALTAVAGPGAVVLPRYIEDERDYGGRSVHTVVLFPSPGGWGQATALRLHLEDSAAGMFDIATFGSVYVRAVSAAYMALASGANYAPATLPAHSKASAMFSLAWPKGRSPAWVGGAQVQAFVAAVKARLPGAVMHVVRHVIECRTSSCGGHSHSRTLLTNSGGWGSQPSCQGRVVFNTVVAHPNRALLMQLVRLVERQLGAVWSPSKAAPLLATSSVAASASTPNPSAARPPPLPA